MTLIVMGRRRGNAISVVQPFFQDDFTGGQRNNANGVTYGSTSGDVSVVTFDGWNALRFRYGPNAGGVGQNAEQRINFGRNVTTFAVDCFVYVPTNYAHRTTGVPAQNNKLIRVWGNDYNAENKVGASAWPQASPGPSYMQFDYTRYGQSGIGPGLSGTANSWFDGSWQGRWSRYRWLFRHASADGVSDGLMQVWQDDTLKLSFPNVDQEWTAAPFWNAMYLFGFANSGFSEQTDFYVRTLRFYDEPPGWT